MFDKHMHCLPVFERLLLVSALWIVMFLCNAVHIYAQTEAADFSRIGYGAYLTANVTDYQSVGINPANLGFRPRTDIYQLADPTSFGIERNKRQWAFSIAEGGVTAHSDALPKSGLLDALLNNASIQFTREEKLTAARLFAGNGLRFSADIFAAGVSYQHDYLGGIALTIRERIMGTFVFNEGASRLAFEGRYYNYFDSASVNFNGDTIGYATNPQRYSTLFDGTRLAMNWFRELGVSYGINVLQTEAMDFYVGASGKYLLAYAFLDAFVSDSSLQARSALSPFFGINYGKGVSPSFIPGNAFEPVGRGWGVDLGITIRYMKYTLGISVVDLGAIRYDGNVYVAKDTILNGMSSTGFDSYNIFAEAPKITGDGNYFKWDGLATATTVLPTRLRIGMQYSYSYRLKFGFDIVAPLNTSAGSLGEPIGTVGLDARVLPWLKLGGGLGGGGNMKFFMPFSISASVLGGLWEMGLGTRDLFTFITSDSPLLSVTFGFARFRL